MTIRHISYLVQNIQVHLKNPPLTLGRTRRELEPTALVWGGVCRGCQQEHGRVNHCELGREWYR